MSKPVDYRSSLAYRKKLKQISDDLTSGEVGQLKGLTADRIPAGRRETISTAQKLFDSLENLGLLKIDNQDYLIRLLQQIGRNDIINKHNLQWSGKESLEKKAEVKFDDSFNSLLLVLSQQIPSADLESMKGLAVDFIPRGRLQHVTDGFAFFGELGSANLLSETNLGVLIDMLDVIGRKDLSRVVQEFEKTKKVTKPSGLGGLVITLGSRYHLATAVATHPQQSSHSEDGHHETQYPKMDSSGHDSTIPVVVSGCSGTVDSQSIKEKISGPMQQTPESMELDPLHGNQSTMQDWSSASEQTHAQASDRSQLNEYRTSLKSQNSNETRVQPDPMDAQGQMNGDRPSLQLQNSNGTFVQPEPIDVQESILGQLQKSNRGLTQPSAPPQPTDDLFGMRQEVVEAYGATEIISLRQKLDEAVRATDQLKNQKQQEIEEIGHRLHQEQRMREDMERRQREAAVLEADTRRLQQELDAARQATQQLEDQKQQEVEAVQQRLNQELRRKHEIEVEKRRAIEEVRYLRARQQQLQQTPHLDSVVECYPMTNNPHGFAVIISNERFPDSRVKLTDRQGTERDVENLKHTFEKLNLVVRTHRNLTGPQLVSTMRQYGAQDHSKYDCFVCCILSHGKKDFIYGSNSEPVSIEQLTSQVNGLSCPSLVKKPKLFFIQACRGTDEDQGTEIDSALDKCVSRDAHEQIKIPLQADYLLGYAAPRGNVSFRSTTHGSWYISALCNVLDTCAHRGVSLSDMLILVNQRLAEATTSDGFKQIPSPINQLTRRVVFPQVPQ